MKLTIDNVAWPERFAAQQNAIWLPGDTVQIRGQTGSGKSSFLDVLSGFARPRSGCITFHGMHGEYRIPSGRTDLSIYHVVARVAGLGVGRLFQDAQRFASMTVSEMLILAGRSGCACRGLEPLIIQELLRLAGIASTKWMAELSYGQTRMVAFACACIIGKHVLILDEPAAGLHQRIREYLRELLTAVAAANVLIVAAEHDDGLLTDPTCTLYMN